MVQTVPELISRYKASLALSSLQDEVYKWAFLKEFQGKPDVSASDFAQEYKSIKYGNLTYHLAPAVGNHICREKPEEFRKIFIALFDENVELNKRVRNFSNESLKLYRSIGETKQHHQDERTISVYLSLHFPNKYTFFKDSYYQQFCKLKGIPTAKKNEKYAHYIELLNEFIRDYILTDTDLILSVKNVIPDFYDGTNHLLLAQDILYTILDKEQAEVNYWVFQGNPSKYNFKNVIKEGILNDWTASAHRDKFKIGDKIIFWLSGKEAGCYALGEIRSEPFKHQKDHDDNWKVDDTSEWKIGIEITHDLSSEPILKDVIDATNEFKNLKVGHQGTNFAATQDEYLAFIDIVNSKKSGAYNKIKKALDSDKLEVFLGILRKFTAGNNLTEDDSRISFNIRESNCRLVFEIGSRYSLCIEKKKKETILFFISEQDITNTTEIPFKNKKGEPEAYWNQFDFSQQTNFESLVFEGLQTELQRNYKCPYKNYSNHEFALDILGELKTEKMSQKPLNQILYGPPGTGKTYSTIDMVVDILEPNNSFNREEKKAKYDQLITDNRAFFTTFHQSMSYEEFIEGIKPHTVNDQIRYEVTNGILKDIVEQCFEDIKALKAMSASGTTVLSFKEKFHEFSKAIQLGKIVLKTRSGIPVQLSKTSNAGNLQLNSGEDTRDYVISMKRLEKLVAAFPNPKVIKNIHEEIRSVIGGSNSSLYFSALDAFVSFDKKLTDTVQEDGKEMSLSEIVLTAEEIASLPPYFLIIDEINRGNVSAIFGELITLIEEDKRFGRNNQLFVTLPYSREEFILPPNLYIIGTMNTADRSVEALDTALRRRFSFVEKLPNPERLKDKGEDKNGNVGSINLPELLSVINARIEVLVDRDHTIGHAFFMDVKSIEDLKHVFADKIIPLLQEYFYGNYAKMEMVLGPNFFDEKNGKKPIQFAVQNNNIEVSETNYKLKNIHDDSFDLEKALKRLLNTSDSEVEKAN